MGFDEEFSRQWESNCTSDLSTTIDCLYMFCYNNAECIQIDDPDRGLIASCSCASGFAGINCEKCCDMPCENGGECQIDFDTQLPYCNCATNFTRHIQNGRDTGLLCTDLWNDTDPLIVTENFHTTSWEVPLIVSSVLIIIIGASLFATLFAMYKKRHPWLVKLLVQYNARFIDDTDRRYDAFLSYQSSSEADRKFVVYQLLPYLESEGYTLCIDQRDFIPGAAITTTVAEAIQESKRTILVLSPAYVEGEWPEFEVQCALRESLKKNHRVIPVIFEPLTDVEQHISHALSHVMDSITCIEWSNEQKLEREFWRRLLIALPKPSSSPPPPYKEAPCSTTPEKRLQSQISQTSQNSQSVLIEGNESTGGSSNLFSRSTLQNMFSLFKSRSIHPMPHSTSAPTISKSSNPFITVNPGTENSNTSIPLNIPKLVTSDGNDCESKVHNISTDLDASVVNNLDDVRDDKYVALKMVC